MHRSRSSIEQRSITPEAGRRLGFVRGLGVADRGIARSFSTACANASPTGRTTPQTPARQCFG